MIEKTFEKAFAHCRVRCVGNPYGDAQAACDRWLAHYGATPSSARRWTPVMIQFTRGWILVVRLPKTEPVEAVPLRQVSLAEARQLAIRALEEAETRRQNEREREAVFWSALEDDEQLGEKKGEK